MNDTLLTTGKSYLAEVVPEAFEVFNNSGNPTLKAIGIIVGTNVIAAPDEVRFGQCLDLQSPSWSEEGRPIGDSDSGYALKRKNHLLTLIRLVITYQKNDQSMGLIKIH